MTKTALKRLLVVALLWLAAPWAAALNLPASQQFTLDNGMVVILTPKPDVPMISARVAIRGGALADAPGLEGSASLLADLLGKGAGTRDAQAFVRAVADVGGELAFSADREAVWVSADFLAADAPLMLELMADALQRPQLDQAEFDKLRTRAVQSLVAMKDGDPRGLVSIYGEAWLFRGHPYGRSVSGDETSLQRLKRADLEAYFKTQLGADRAILSLAGDFEPGQMIQAIQSRFGQWRKATGALPEVSAQARVKGRQVLFVDKPGATQTYFWIGQVGAAVGDAAEPAQNLVQTLFGGRFTSMLNTELRVKSGLTYGARASLDRMALPGAAAWSSFTRTDATVRAIDMGLAVQARLHAEPLNDAALESARNYVLGQFAPDYETSGQLAEAFAALALHGLSRDNLAQYDHRIQTASVQAVNAARSVFANNDDYAMVVIGDGDKIAKDLARYGTVTRMRITDPGFLPAAQ